MIPDPHAHYAHDNSRATLLSKLIIDLRPDVVVNLGDSADLPSLSSYDKGLRSFQGKTYKGDINAHLDFEDKLWTPVKKTKKRLPFRVFLEGNHEHRIERALDLSPELQGTVSFRDLDLEKNYDEIVMYTGKTTPGTITIDGILYAHFLVSGVMGRPMGGEHAAYTILSKQFTSCTVGHTHTMDYCVRPAGDGFRKNGLVAGCFLDYKSDWAGEQQRYWWPGVVIKRGVENGQYDVQFVSLNELRRVYQEG